MNWSACIILVPDLGVGRGVLYFAKKRLPELPLHSRKCHRWGDGMPSSDLQTPVTLTCALSQVSPGWEIVQGEKRMRMNLGAFLSSLQRGEKTERVWRVLFAGLKNWFQLNSDPAWFWKCTSLKYPISEFFTNRPAIWLLKNNLGCCTNCTRFLGFQIIWFIEEKMIVFTQAQGCTRTSYCTSRQNWRNSFSFYKESEKLISGRKERRKEELLTVPRKLIFQCSRTKNEKRN